MNLIHFSETEGEKLHWAGDSPELMFGRVLMIFFTCIHTTNYQTSSMGRQCVAHSVFRDDPRKGVSYIPKCVVLDGRRLDTRYGVQNGIKQSVEWLSLALLLRDTAASSEGVEEDPMGEWCLTWIWNDYPAFAGWGEDEGNSRTRRVWRLVLRKHKHAKDLLIAQYDWSVWCRRGCVRWCGFG